MLKIIIFEPKAKSSGYGSAVMECTKTVRWENPRIIRLFSPCVHWENTRIIRGFSPCPCDMCVVPVLSGEGGEGQVGGGDQPLQQRHIMPLLLNQLVTSHSWPQLLVVT